jgi:transposase
MLAVGGATRVYLAVGVTDLRKGFDGLYGLVRSKLESDPVTGHLFVFCNGSRNLIKVLHFDGTGLWICAKRLEQGRFRWPAEAGACRVSISAEELSMLLGGMDPGATKRRKWWRSEPVTG